MKRLLRNEASIDLARWIAGALATLLLVCVSWSAHAQNSLLEKKPAILQSHVVVSDHLVTLGDLFENAGEVADKAVFRSPSIGQSGTIRANRVIAAARRVGLTNVASGDVSVVRVLRDSQLVTEQDILAGLIAILRTKGYVSGTDRVDIELTTALVDQHASPHTSRPFDIRNLRFDRTNGRFTANLSIGGREDIGTIRLSGRALETILTPVLTRNMRRGEILMETDISLMPLPKRQALASRPAKIKSIIGLATRQPLRAGMVANSAYFTAPDIIERSGVVTILFRAGNLTLSMRGKALADGAKGDTIAVQNLQTGKIIRGSVIGPGLLEIHKPANTIAALGAKLQ